ncbi:hypothetical protein [Kitasatospora kazusensis]
MSGATWRDWSGSIRAQMGREPYRRLWAQAIEDSDFKPDYTFRHLRILCGPGGETYGPRQRRPARCASRAKGAVQRALGVMP